MILKETVISAVDNSGAKQLKCIQNTFKSNFLMKNKIIKCSIKRLRTKRRIFSKVKKKQLVLILILNSCQYLDNKKPYIFKFKANNGILLTSNFKPIGTRIVCKLPKSIRYSNFLKLITLGGSFIR